VESYTGRYLWQTQLPSIVEMELGGRKMAGFVGKEVKVVRGRKVPKGTVGNCFWGGMGYYGYNIGIITAAGEKYFVAAKNCELANPVEEEMPEYRKPDVDGSPVPKINSTITDPGSDNPYAPWNGLFPGGRKVREETTLPPPKAGLDSDDPGPYIEPPKLEKKAESALLWSKREVLETKQDAYYDWATYKVPVLGEVDVPKIDAALRAKWAPRPNVFGGYSTIEGVEAIPGENAVKVRMAYHIGE
jgi:hypothetical protein